MSGTVIYGWFAGVVETIDRIGSGAASAYRDLGTWIAEGVIGSLLEIPIGTIETAVGANSEFLASLGVIAPVVAAIELLVVVWIIVRATEESISLLGGLIA
jgi:hypothetical protein